MGIGTLIRSLFTRKTPGPELTPEAFAEEIRQRVLAAGVDAHVSGPLQVKVRHGDGSERSVFLDNAYQMVRREPEADRDDLIDRFVRSYVESGEAMHASADAIVPVVKDHQWLHEVSQSLAERGAASDALENVHDRLNDALMIVYAVDTPNNIAYLKPSELEKLPLQRSELRRVAVRNLRGLLPRIDVHRGPLVSMVTADGNYEASLLLFDDLWERERSRMSGDPVMAVPARDVLIFADSAKPEAVAELRQLAAQVRQQCAYALTDALFVWRDGALHVWDREAATSAAV